MDGIYWFNWSYRMDRLHRIYWFHWTYRSHGLDRFYR